MAQKRVHKKDHDSHNEKDSRVAKQTQREQNTPTGESLEHRSNQSIVEAGVNEQKGEPIRPGHLTPKGRRPLENR